ncbi:hypothetical protein O7627_10820 [Solwaraspora sp. WMMD1047]|uniref:hypothetical protein n=1 Tax=Solwaraspora sp. WMMD1047 TaxID=3016102 RepID=UPI002417D20A|nr:hypothetical protein [Solwaraspora sp. WMMD1047]MDG4829792.1 hypothetical protein [Solwaraspora sp. WMMD1047]
MSEARSSDRYAAGQLLGLVLVLLVALPLLPLLLLIIIWLRLRHRRPPDRPG